MFLRWELAFHATAVPGQGRRTLVDRSTPEGAPHPEGRAYRILYELMCRFSSTIRDLY